MFSSIGWSEGSGGESGSSPTNATTAGGTAPKRICLVCGDTASGFHYGVASCEACKAFFKRTIQGNIEYTCPATSDCEINKRRRKACQACRFHKCLRMGMLKEGVRLDRVRGGRQKYRRVPDSTGYHHTVQMHSSSQDSASHPLANRPTTNSSQDLNGSGSTHSGGTTTSGSGTRILTHRNGGDQSQLLACTKKQPIEDNKLLCALMNCEPDVTILNANSVGSGGRGSGESNLIHFCSGASPTSPSPAASPSLLGGGGGGGGGCGLDFHDTPLGADRSEITDYHMRVLSDIIDKELVETIGFAKQIPGFTDLLLNDQMRLLQSTWAEVLSLTLAYRSQHMIASNELKLVINCDLVIDENDAINSKMSYLFLELVLFTRRLAHLNISREEYLLLKALVLTNADIQVEDEEGVKRLREMADGALQDVVSSIRSPSLAMSHLSQILLSLPMLRQLDSTMRSYWTLIREEGKVPMNKLFIEMLDSHSAGSGGPPAATPAPHHHQHNNNNNNNGSGTASEANKKFL